MQIKKDGIFRTIDSKDFGIYQQSGWGKVIVEPLPKLEEAKVESVIEDEPIAEVVDEEPIKEVEQPIGEIVDEMPKSKKSRRK